MNSIIPLRERKLDLAFIVFFIINIGFITYVVDVEQLVIADPAHFTYPLWPPRPLVDMVHWWGRTFDPALMAREPWWRATIWLDVLGFGPFYVVAIYAFAKGRDFIRVPAFVWSGVMFANVVIIPKNTVEVLAVPQSAIVLENNNYYVMKETGDKVFEKVRVRVGKNYDRNTEVIDGLKEGDHIISEGSLFALTGYNLK